MFVNFVGDNRHVITRRDIQNIENMVAAEHRTAWIRGIVYNYRCRRFVDLRLQVIEIDFPTAFRLKAND